MVCDGVCNGAADFAGVEPTPVWIGLKHSLLLVVDIEEIDFAGPLAGGGLPGPEEATQNRSAERIEEKGYDRATRQGEFDSIRLGDAKR